MKDLGLRIKNYELRITEKGIHSSSYGLGKYLNPSSRKYFSQAINLSTKIYYASLEFVVLLSN